MVVGYGAGYVVVVVVVVVLVDVVEQVHGVVEVVVVVEVVGGGPEPGQAGPGSTEANTLVSKLSSGQRTHTLNMTMPERFEM